MQAAREMTRDRQINFRLSDDEGDRFEYVADYYGLPISAVIRMLMKERFDQIEAGRGARLDEAQRDVLSHFFAQETLALAYGSKIELSRDDIAMGLTRGGKEEASVNRALNALRREDYLTKKDAVYSLTPKGRAYLAGTRARTGKVQIELDREVYEYDFSRGPVNSVGDEVIRVIARHATFGEHLVGTIRDLRTWEPADPPFPRWNDILPRVAARLLG